MNLHDINFSEAGKLHLKSAINIIKKEYGDNLIGLYLFGSEVQGGLKK